MVSAGGGRGRHAKAVKTKIHKHDPDSTVGSGLASVFRHQHAVLSVMLTTFSTGVLHASLHGVGERVNAAVSTNTTITPIRPYTQFQGGLEPDRQHHKPTTATRKNCPG